MIDFQNAAFFKLIPVALEDYPLADQILLPGEEVLAVYQSLRDGVVFTDKRIIAINVQGITGKKKDFTSLPYSKITAFSVETAGSMDLDGELDLWFGGMGKVRFEFTSAANILEICRKIASFVL